MPAPSGVSPKVAIPDLTHNVVVVVALTYSLEGQLHLRRWGPRSLTTSMGANGLTASFDMLTLAIAKLRTFW